MKICIITLHSIHNPGSALQAYALQQYLETIDNEVNIIDYRPYYSILGKNKIKGIARCILFFKNEQKISKVYYDFQNKYFCLTKKYFSYSALKNNPPDADIYIVGSDQLWNMDYDCGNDNAYYLRFVSNGIKVSYSTSVGKSVIPDDQISLIASKINDFQHIAVREKHTADELSKRLKRKVRWVCDPVFLLPAEHYQQITEEILRDPYVMIYLSPENDLLNEVVRSIKENTRYKVVLVGGNTTRCECDMHIKDVGPTQFLSLIRYAEIIVSSSFHATAFSHIFHKKFGTLIPSKNGERILDLLRMTGLEKHALIRTEDIDTIYEEIDYSLVQKKLDDFINSSKNYLQNVIAGCTK